MTTAKAIPPLATGAVLGALVGLLAGWLDGNIGLWIGIGVPVGIAVALSLDRGTPSPPDAKENVSTRERGSRDP